MNHINLTKGKVENKRRNMKRLPIHYVFSQHVKFQIRTFDFSLPKAFSQLLSYTLWLNIRLFWYIILCLYIYMNRFSKK